MHVLLAHGARVDGPAGEQVLWSAVSKGTSHSAIVDALMTAVGACGLCLNA